MQLNLKPLALLTVGASLLALSQNASAEGRLNVYCTMSHAACEQLTQQFAKKYNVDVKTTVNSTGTTFGKLKAEKNNPQADVWFGGTVDPHYQAGELGLLQPYRSAHQKYISPQFKSLTAGKKGETTSIIYMMILGFGVNTERLKQLGISKPKSWADLLNPKLKGEVQMPELQASGTSYTTVATLVQLMGEEKAFAYLKKLNGNVSQYVKSGVATHNISRGEAAIGVNFIHPFVLGKSKGEPVDYVIPAEGSTYSLGGVSIIKGARNLENAKRFVDWALLPEAQETMWKASNVYTYPTNINAKRSPLLPDPKKLKLINFNFERFGSSAEGKRLTQRWLNEVKLAK